MMKKNLALLLLLLTAPVLFSRAEQVRSGNFRIISSSRIGTDLFYFNGESYQPCLPQLNRITEPYSFRLKVPDLRFFHRQVEINEEGKEEFRHLPVGRAAIPESGSYLLFVNPEYVDPEQSAEVRGYRMQVLLNPFVEDKPGQWLFLNFTDHAIVAQIGEEARHLTLPPQGRADWRAERSRPFTLVKFAARIDNEPRMFYSSGWPVRPESSYLVVFGPGSPRRPIAVSRFPFP